MPQGQYSLAEAKPIGAYSLADATPAEPSTDVVVLNGKTVNLKGLTPDVAQGFRDAAAHHTDQGDLLLETITSAGGKLINALPYVGGAVGGVMGAPAGPVGSVALAALGGAAGEGVKTAATRIGRAVQTGDTTTPIDTAATAGNMAKQAAIQGGSQAAGEAIGAGMKAAGPWLMQKALKPTASLVSEYKTSAPKLVQTLLDEGVSVTQAGMEKLQKLFDATNADIRDAVANAPGSIEKNTIAARVLPTASKVAQQVNPAADLQAVGDTVEQFMNHPVYKGALSIPEAQAMKQGTYQQIGKKYGEVSSAAIEAQKALARGLKEEIAAEVPGLAGLNTRDSELMAALDATGRRVALAGNKDPVGFAWVTSHPVTFLASLFDRSPAVKSMVARGLYQSAGAAAKVSPQLIRMAVSALAGASDATDGATPVSAGAPAPASSDSTVNPRRQ